MALIFVDCEMNTLTQRVATGLAVYSQVVKRCEVALASNSSEQQFKMIAVKKMRMAAPIASLMTV